MLYTIAQPEFHRIRPLFPEQHLALMSEAMIAGNSPAQMWVDNAGAPQSVYVWDGRQCHFLAGAAGNSDFNDRVRQLIAATVAPSALERGLRYFKVNYTTDAWQSVIPSLYPPHAGLKQRRRFCYALDHLNIPDWRAGIPAGFSVQRIDREMLAQRSLKHVQWMVEEIESCWPALDLFLDKAFGFYARTADAVAGWCTGEYVSRQQLGIGIETIEEFQKRGLATALASAFAEHALANCRTAHWDAYAENTPSVRVAEKVGFKKIADYTIFAGMLGT